VEAEWTSTVEVPNLSPFHNCKCLVPPNRAFRLAPIQVPDSGPHHPLRLEEIRGAASHLDSRTRPQAKVQAETSLLVRIPKLPRARVEAFHLLHQSLQRTYHLLGSLSVNPRQLANLHPPPDLRSANRDLKQLMRHLPVSPLRHRNQSNTRPVLRLDRHRQNLRDRLLLLVSDLDKRSLSNLQLQLRSRLALPQAAGHLDLHPPVLHLAHSNWHPRRRRRSPPLEGPPVHRLNSPRQIHSGLVRRLGNPRRLPYSKVSRLTLGEVRRRRRRHRLEHPHRRPLGREIAEVPCSRWAPNRRRQYHHLPGPGQLGSCQHAEMPTSSGKQHAYGALRVPESHSD
jgi:hypothetical protein